MGKFLENVVLHFLLDMISMIVEKMEQHVVENKTENPSKDALDKAWFKLQIIPKDQTDRADRCDHVDQINHSHWIEYER